MSDPVSRPSRANTRVRRHQVELAGYKADLVRHVQAVAESQLTSSDAQRILEAANAWEPRPARALAAHLAEHPDALTAPISHSPAALPRLLLGLAAAGFAVTRLACARCGRTDNPSPRNSSVGRLCNWCVERDRLQQCTQCERQTRIHSRTADGPVCRSCFQKNPVNHRQCDRCQRLRPPAGARMARPSVFPAAPAPNAPASTAAPSPAPAPSQTPARSAPAATNGRRAHAASADRPPSRSAQRTRAPTSASRARATASRPVRRAAINAEALFAEAAPSSVTAASHGRQGPALTAASPSL